MSRALESLYNIPCALRAFKMFQNEYPQASMVILGDGSEKQSLERLARDLGLHDVEFRGRVERASIPEVYDSCDIFLNTSSIDNMPVSILEAFAAGLPVVTTDAGGIPWLVTDIFNGHLVLVNDHLAVSERLVEIMRDIGVLHVAFEKHQLLRLQINTGYLPRHSSATGPNASAIFSSDQP